MVIEKNEQLYEIYKTLENVDTSSLVSYANNVKDNNLNASKMSNYYSELSNSWDDNVKVQTDDSVSSLEEIFNEQDLLSEFISSSKGLVDTLIEATKSYVDCYDDYLEHLDKEPSNKEETYEDPDTGTKKKRKTSEYKNWLNIDNTFSKTIVVLESQGKVLVDKVKEYFASYEDGTMSEALSNLINNPPTLLTYNEVFDYFENHSSTDGETNIVDIMQDVYIFVKSNELFTTSLGEEMILEVANGLMDYAIKDSQISTTGKFEDFTDFQNIALASISFLELVYPEDYVFDGQTIKELFIESCKSSNEVYSISDYATFIMDANEVIRFDETNNMETSRNKLLGKLITFGFGDIKVNEVVKGSNGFDAIVLEDKNNEIMIYYPCTNMKEIEDYMFDVYPLARKAEDKSIVDLGITKSLFGGYYDSQIEQANDLVQKYLDTGKTVNIGGFSLGGCLAESSYVYASSTGNENVGSLTTFNAYHYSASNKVVQAFYNKALFDANNEGKVHMYSSNGDCVSTLFNYDATSKMTQTVYVDVDTVLAEGRATVHSDQSAVSTLLTSVKDEFCQEIASYNIPGVSSLASTLMQYPINSNDFANAAKIGIETFDAGVSSLAGIPGAVYYFSGGRIIDPSIVDDIQNLEIVFSGAHLPYTVETYREVAFDSNGNVVPLSEIPTGASNIELFETGAMQDVQGYLCDLDN